MIRPQVLDLFSRGFCFDVDREDSVFFLASRATSIKAVRMRGYKLHTFLITEMP